MSMPPPSFRPLDPGRVNTTDPVELAFWSAELDCSVEDLMAVIDEVGEHIAAVRAALERRGPGST
jgi:hypothetical protein